MWCGRQTCTVELILTGSGREDRFSVTLPPATLQRYKTIVTKEQPEISVLFLFVYIFYSNFTGAQDILNTTVRFLIFLSLFNDNAFQLNSAVRLAVLH